MAVSFERRGRIFPDEAKNEEHGPAYATFVKIKNEALSKSSSDFHDLKDSDLTFGLLRVLNASQFF
jgi:hypothetical protein